MANLSSNEIRAEYEGEKSNISELEDRLREAESQLLEGERLRKKLHNTILELKGNIRIFCRVRPMLSHDAPGPDAILCYPTSLWDKNPNSSIWWPKNTIPSEIVSCDLLPFTAMNLSLRI